MKNDIRKNIINEIKKESGNAPDVIYKDFTINKETITLIYSNSVSSQSSINDFILRRLDEDKDNIKINLYDYFKDYIPNNSINEINTVSDALYFLFSGFTVVVFNSKNMLAIENKELRNSDIQKSENEVSIKGPNDAFCENYEANTGILRRRMKTEKLWLKEATVGSLSKTKVALFYIDGLCDPLFVDQIYAKICDIDIKYVGNTNYILDAISNPNRSIFPVNLTTERPDFACQMLLEGRIILMCENSKEVIILPCTFIDFFKHPDDYYEKSLNVISNRLIRIIAILLALLTPAIYISLMAYNIEAIPSGLLINFSIQRDGVPFSTIFEIIAMNFMFQILRESDMRFPGKGGSSISIVGALVLGQAAVEAGIVSPITIIIVGISAVSSLAFSSIELINSIRWWQLILTILAAIFGFTGVIFGTFILFALLISETSCGKPYFSPFLPFDIKRLKDTILVNNKYKFNPKNIFDKGENNEENN